jgi:putative acetyltransferase
MSYRIRRETEADHAAIHALTARAFAPMPFAAGDEQVVPDRLRRAGRLALSLVGEAQSEIIAHIAFSRLLRGAQFTDWFAIGPVSVAPDRQRVGHGGAIIRAGIAALTDLGARGFALTGALAYYQRFGFVPAPQWAPNNEPAAFFQVLKITGEDPPDGLAFDPAFYGEA